MISSAPDPLDRSATLGRLDLVLAAAATPPAARSRVLAMASRTPPADEWRAFLTSALLLLGAGLVLSGIVSFFAFNWAAIGTFAKLGLVASAMAACALAALRRPDTLATGETVVLALAPRVGAGGTALLVDSRDADRRPMGAR